MTNEIVPVSVGHSKTNGNNEHNYGAVRAVDLNWASASLTVAAPDGKYWWKANLGQVHCVYQVIEFQQTSVQYRAWTCSEDDCPCSGTYCSSLLATVSSEGATTDLPTLAGCKYGDFVKLESHTSFYLYEVAVTKKPGERSF